MDIRKMDVQPRTPSSIRDLVRLNKYSAECSQKGFSGPAPPAASPVDPGAYASYGNVVDELQWLLGLVRLRTGASEQHLGPTDGAAHSWELEARLEEQRQPSADGSGSSRPPPRDFWSQMDAAQAGAPCLLAAKEPASPPAPTTPTASYASSRPCTAFARELATRCPSSPSTGSPTQQSWKRDEVESQAATDDPWLEVIWQRIHALRAALTEPL